MFTSVLANSNAASAPPPPPAVAASVGHGSSTSAAASTALSASFGDDTALSASFGDDAAMAARPTIDIVGRPMPPLDPAFARAVKAPALARAPSIDTDFVTGGKAGALADQAAEQAAEQKAQLCGRHARHTWPWWRRVLAFAALWALIVALVVGAVSFLFSPLLSAPQPTESAASDATTTIVWNWKVPLYNAVLSGVLTFALSTALAAVPRE